MSRGRERLSNRPSLRNLNPVFHKRDKSEDNSCLSPSIMRMARKTGVLKLNNKGLATVPDQVYEINEADKNIEVTLESLVAKEEEAWWNQEMLTNLDLSSNTLTTISPNIEKLFSLTILSLHNNALAALPKEIGKLEKLNRINVSHNKLQALPDELYTLPDLRYLNVSHNQFEELQPAISDLHMLEHLDASENQLKSLPCGVGFLVRLTDLLLAKNQITELPADLVNMRSLRHLDLTKNNLTKLPEDMGSLRKLQLLYVPHNDIAELPDFDGCSDLQELYASNNNLKALPENFPQKLPHLKILELRDNFITELPSDIALLQSLIRLDITNNTVNSLPYGLASLAHLVHLQVDGNPIKSIRREVLSSGTQRILKVLRDRAGEEQTATANMPNDGLNFSRAVPRDTDTFFDDTTFPDRFKMRKTRCLVVTMQAAPVFPDDLFENAREENVSMVDLSRNKLETIPEGLQCLKNCMSELILSQNCIAAVPPFISQFTNISLINLACNALSELPNEFGLLNTLRELNISGNRFDEIPKAVYELNSLEILLARDNRIVKIDPTPEGLGKLKRLASLDLANNSIEQVPPMLGTLTNIHNLELMGNRFRQPRHQIIERGTEAVMSYLRDRIPKPTGKPN